MTMMNDYSSTSQFHMKGFSGSVPHSFYITCQQSPTGFVTKSVSSLYILVPVKPVVHNTAPPDSSERNQAKTETQAKTVTESKM